MLHKISTTKYFLKFHKWYHWNVEPHIGVVHTKFLNVIFIKLGGVSYDPEKEK